MYIAACFTCNVVRGYVEVDGMHNAKGWRDVKQHADTLACDLAAVL